MYPQRSMQWHKRLITATFTIILVINVEASALEPVTALDDGFAVPSTSGLTEASLHFPGTESYIDGVFGTVAWSRPFGVDDLSITTFHAGAGFGKAGVSVSFSGSGFDLYGDEQEKLGFSYAFFKEISCGVRLTRSAMRIRGYGDASALSADFGVVFHPIESLYIAGSVEEINGSELGDSRESIDGHTRLSAAWKVHQDVILIGGFSKVRRFDPSFSGGFTVEVYPSLTIGAIGGNEPGRMEFLGALTVRGFVCSYRGMYHRDLGMSHGFSLIIKRGLGKK
ncbi:MAG: hypothetical protein JXB48_07875 [Candidatus Latescibacteria bacterium]|nr:hypothetical protein [Candidatus Latescibacterota bacterium]